MGGTKALTDKRFPTEKLAWNLLASLWRACSFSRCCGCFEFPEKRY